jgi:hypothetical protein
MNERPAPRVPWPTLAYGLVILIGFTARVRQYAAGASLWVDEVALALNIIRGSWAELLRPLNYLQGAPVGFLWLSKLAVTLGNDGEMWLRLVPLLAGLLALVLFPFVARHYLSRNATLFGLLLLALSPRLIYYSAEVKQYSLDVLVTIGGLALFVFLHRRPLTPGRAVFAAIAGALLLWLSHAAVFMVGTIGLYLVWTTWRESRAARVMALLIGLAWLLAFAGLLALTLTDLTRNDALLSFWAGGFPPSLSTGVGWLRWHWQKANELPTYTLGLLGGGVALLAALSGVVAFYRQDRGAFFSLVGPLGLLLLAAWLQRYPLLDRLTLFTAPLLVILIARGTEELMRRLRPVARPLAYAVPLILLFEPAAQTWDAIRQPQLKEELAPVLAHVRQQWQPGDHIYLYHGTSLAFDYYGPRYGFDEGDVTVGVQAIKDWPVYYRELDELAAGGGRVWLVFAHVHEGSGAHEEKLFIEYLRSQGHEPIDAFAARNAAAFLFDFGQPPNDS